MFKLRKWFKRGISAVLIASMMLFGAASMVLAGGGTPAAPDLGAAGSFAVLSETAAVTLGTSHIAGDVSHGAAFTNSSTITGTVYASNGAANSAFEAAYAELAGMSVDQTLTTLGGATLSPGVYGIAALDAETSKTLILDAGGNANAVWIIKIGTTGGYFAGTSFDVNIINGGVARNVYWWVDTYVALTSSNFQGNILAGGYIEVTGGTINGNAQARGYVTTKTGAIIISPMYGTQLWRLDQTTVMEKAGGINDDGQTGTLIVSGESIWIADQAASSDVIFADGQWTVKLEPTADWSSTCSAEVGYYDPTTGFQAFAPADTGSYSNGIISITINAGGMVSKDDYLALKINNSGTAQDIITEGSSYAVAPAIVPDYPLPELSAGILLAMGLAGLVGFMVVRRKKALDVKIDRA
jgi:hypothetical protein